MKKITGILVLAVFASMADTSYAREGDDAFEQAFASALVAPVKINDFAFDQAFARALASSQKSASAAPKQYVKNRFENDDAFVGPFKAAFAASYDQIAAAMRYKIVKDGNTADAAYAYTVIGMLKRGVTAKGGERLLSKELDRIGYGIEDRLALK